MVMMNRELLKGILVVLGIVATVLNPLIGGILAAGVWIYLVRTVWKQKKSAFNDEMELEISRWYLNRLKVLLTVAGFSFLVFVVGTIMHNILDGLSKIEESVFFLIALGALLVFIAATAGGMAIFLRARQNKT